MDDIIAARRFTAALRSRARAVGRNPRLIHWWTGSRRQVFAAALYRGYPILYVESNRRVEVLHIVHAARDRFQLIEDEPSR
jgi:plasmid stabilization system protein ParE